MTNKELIEKLQVLDPNACICILDQDDFYPVEISTVTVMKSEEVSSDLGWVIKDSIIVLHYGDVK